MKSAKGTLATISVCVALAAVVPFFVPQPSHSHYKDPSAKEVHRYVVFADTHFYGAHGLNDLALAYGPDTFYLGDIYDLKNAAKDDVEKAEKAIRQLRDRAGKRYVRGNHEVYAFGAGAKAEDYYTTQGGILFTHGHYNICYSDEEVTKWESAKAGAGTFKRAGRKWLEGVVEKPDRPRREAVTHAAEMVVRHNKAHPDDPCHTIVFGHTHVKKVFAETVDKIRVVNVPMGMTELDL